MAFVTPSPQESIALLQQVLKLDPGNERAEAGIRWAKKRLAPTPATTEIDQTRPEPEQVPGPAQAAEEPPEMPDEFIREQLLTHKDYQKRAKKGALAHRARRTIDPLLTVFLVLIAAALLTAGIWLVAIAPADTLAAWLPAPVESMLVNSGALTALPEEEFSRPVSPVGRSRPDQTFASGGDTIFIERSEPGQTILSDLGLSRPMIGPVPGIGPDGLISLPQDLLEAGSFLLELQGEVEATAETAGASVASDVEPIQPDSFIGPADMLLTGPRLFEPVSEELLFRLPTTPDEKWIEVNVTEQRVTAWEGNVPVMSFLTSTGLPNTPTVLGEFNIYWKLESTLMTGQGYYLPEVPYTMYFFGGYALHGAYWHDNFGNPMSHGCVNLDIDNARELFEWAGPVVPAGQRQVLASYTNPGTLVVVHD
jgi:hypothetical protein